MNLRHLSDQALLDKTESLARQERELLAEILHHLREIYSRRLFSALGFKSVHEYAVKKLGYSGDQAARRISAMHLLREIPELEQKIESGSLNLTNLGLAQTLFRQEQKSKPVPKQAKMELLEQLEHKTTREAEKIVLAASSAPKELLSDRTRLVADDRIEYKFVAHESLSQKLEQVKGLLAHTHADCSMGELLDKMADIALEALTPVRRKTVGAPEKRRETDRAPLAQNIDKAWATDCEDL